LVFVFDDMHCEKKVEAMMVNNSTIINKTKNNLLP